MKGERPPKSKNERREASKKLKWKERSHQNAQMKGEKASKRPKWKERSHQKAKLKGKQPPKGCTFTSSKRRQLVKKIFIATAMQKQPNFKTRFQGKTVASSRQTHGKQALKQQNAACIPPYTPKRERNTPLDARCRETLAILMLVYDSRPFCF